jgi:tetratricopeptide (TPR) repeat protein
MPVSKKPKKSARKAPPKTPALPDRRVMEGFLSALAPPPADDALAAAQQLMYKAWDQTKPASRVALARQALTVSPLCADAYVLLAEEGSSYVEEARTHYEKAVAAAEQALGPDDFEEYRGHFWGFLETRPYMRARAGLAGLLLRTGDAPGAMGHFRDMLALNPNDNQGIRYALLACLLQAGDTQAVTALLGQYPDEASVFWAYTRLLLAFKAGGPADPSLAALLSDAMEENAFVPAILCGTGRTPKASGFMLVGGKEEAADYVMQCGAAWRQTPGALAWLKASCAKSGSAR